MTILLLLLGLFVLIAIDVPIGVALGVVALAAILGTGGFSELPNAALVLYETGRERARQRAGGAQR